MPGASKEGWNQPNPLPPRPCRYDIGGPNHVKLQYNTCGCVYRILVRGPLWAAIPCCCLCCQHDRGCQPALPAPGSYSNAGRAHVQMPAVPAVLQLNSKFNGYAMNSMVCGKLNADKSE